MVACPPDCPMIAGAPPTEYSHGAPCCEKEMSRSAIDTVACRVTGSSFGATRYPTVPSPWPSALVVNVIQLAGVVARHEHSRGTLIDSVPVPPPGPNVLLELETFASQREDAGEVIVVDVVAELPHATEATASTNSRGARRFTAGALHKPRQLRITPVPANAAYSGATVRAGAHRVII
jgi:hypothetical protein